MPPPGIILLSLALIPSGIYLLLYFGLLFTSLLFSEWMGLSGAWSNWLALLLLPLPPVVIGGLSFFIFVKFKGKIRSIVLASVGVVSALALYFLLKNTIFH